MSSLQWTWSAGQPFGSVGHLWGRAASRLQLEWTRFFPEHEETVALTQRDELSRTYCGDNSLSPDDDGTERRRSRDNTGTFGRSGGNESPVLIQIELNRTYCRDGAVSAEDSRAEGREPCNDARNSPGETGAVPTQREEPNGLTVEETASNKIRPTRTFDPDGTGCKETLTIKTAAGPRTTIRASSLSAPDSITCSGGRPHYNQNRLDKTGINSAATELKPRSNQNQRTRNRPYRLARDAGQNSQNQRPAWSDADNGRSPLEPQHLLSTRPGGEVGRDGEDVTEGPSGFCTGPQDQGGSPGLGGVHSPVPATITTWEAGWNVTNAIQGIFVLGLPYALVRSGYLGLVVLALSAWVCNHTGRVLVTCLYEEQYSVGSGTVCGRVRVRHSYHDTAEAVCRDLWPCWPGLGGWTVNVAQLIELMMTCTLYLVVSTSLLADLLSGMAVPRSVCLLFSLVFLLPCLLLTDLKPVSTLSMLCSLAQILISLLVILYCLSQSSRWSWSSLSISADPEDFLVSVGVMIFSYTSQIFLPPIEGGMEDRGEFDAMLGWTHASACIVKTMFSLLAVLTWGEETSEVITDNLPSDLRPLVNLCLLAKALLSYPLPFYSAAEILQTCLPEGYIASSNLGSGGRGVSYPALLVRSTLLMTSYLLALLVPRFSLLMGLTGSVTGAAMTLILPCLFHLRLQWRRLTLKVRVIDMAILSVGVICSVSGVICSLKRLIEGL